MTKLLISLIFFVGVTLVVSQKCNYAYEEYTPEEGTVLHLPQPRDFMLDAPNWADCENSELCASGQSQTPIDVMSGEMTEAPELGPLNFQWRKIENVVLTWTGHNQKFSVAWDKQEKPSYLTHSALDGKYYLLQFHLHTPSEHTINGEHTEVEVHFVHLSEDNKVAVVGVMFEVSDEEYSSDFLDSMIRDFPSNLTNTEEYAFLLDELYPSIALAELGSHDYIHYKGSFTTPPCTEGVDWFLLTNSVMISSEQFQKLTSYQAVNSRPVQPLNSRPVYFYDASSPAFCSKVGSDCEKCKSQCEKACLKMCESYPADQDCYDNCKGPCRNKMCKEVC